MKDQQASFMRVTSEMAEKWLTQNHCNRPLSEFVVSKYQFLMENGAWQLSPDALTFSKEGRLLNGQHRLTALIKAKKTQEFLVVGGFNQETFFVMDKGKTRTFGDTLALQGNPYYGVLSNLAKHCYRYSKYGFKNLSPKDVRGTREMRYSLFDEKSLVEFIGNEPQLLKSLDFIRSLGTQQPIIPITYSAYYHYIFTKKHPLAPKLVDKFFESLLLGEDLPKLSPIVTLRNRLIQGKINRAKYSLKVLTVMVVKTWNAYKADKPLGKFLLAVNMEIPEVL